MLNNENWHISLKCGSKKLKNALKEMEPFKLEQGDVPFIIRLVENPKYDVGVFTGNVDLFTHDCVHVLLGRGLLVKDEAFVIGYTMGSTKKMPRWRRNLFMFISKHLYPEGYKFKEEERFVFNAGVVLGSKCPTDLSKVDFKRGKESGETVMKIRKKIKINEKALENYYKIEKHCFPESPESQRLIHE
jgi:hypothetical protein